MKSIIAIGGGEICDLETLYIDKTIVQLSKKSNPKILFIPTASRESKPYIESFDKVFKDELDCVTDVLLLIDGKSSEAEINTKILDADIIYVGGGNTRFMMSEWRKYGVDKVLREAYHKGIILCGLSAGSICWFSQGQTDTENYERGDLRNYASVEGLGIIHAIHCPHYNEDKRAEDFDNRIKGFEGVGIAIDNLCAVEIRDEKFRVLKVNAEAKAYKIYYFEDQLIKTELDNLGFRPLSELLNMDDPSADADVDWDDIDILGETPFPRWG